MRFSCSLIGLALFASEAFAGGISLGEVIFIGNFDVTKRPLNDTGQRFCDSGELFLVECPVDDGPAGQDAEYGWDALEPDAADGNAGFMFSKFDASGNALPAGSPNWSCLLDHRTLLVWESKQSTGLHNDQDHYSWYLDDPDNNGGDAGGQDPGGECFGYSAIDPDTHCNTTAFTARVNQEQLCGIGRWRLPYPGELLSLVDYSQNVGQGANVDPNYFPRQAQHTEQNEYLWTAMTYPLIISRAVQVNYWIGGLWNGSSKTSTAHVRLVTDWR